MPCTRQTLCDDEECVKCFFKSFESHPKAKYWSDENDKTPRQVFKSSGKKYKFDCKCGHEFEMLLYNITRNKWCPYCVNQKLCDDKNCVLCFDKSFASHKKSKYWSESNEKNPRQVFKSSYKKYTFDCKCGHQFDSTLSNITCKNTWCRYCSKPAKKLCDDENCTSCFNNSFASSKKSKYWSQSNEMTPRQVFKSTDKKYKFVCEHEHKFKARLDQVISGSWCPHCKHKTETKLYEWLKENNYKVTPGAKYDWCKNITFLPFDFAVEKYKIIIELDGRQHFTQVSNWTSPKYTQANDRYKMEKALENGYTVIRLLQEDVWNDKNNWKEKLIKHIRSHKSPKSIFLCDGDEYKCFK